MSQGTIKKIVSGKGFGFIEGENGDRETGDESGNEGENGELFFHSSAVENASFDELREGQSVEFTEGQGPKGPRADNVRVV